LLERIRRIERSLSVSTLTLDRPRATKTRNKTSSPKLSHSPRRLYARKSNTPSPAKLQELEDRLLAAALAHHPDSDRAIAHLLDDVEQLPAGHPTRQLTPLRRHHQLERMDDLLIQAMMRTHPNHDCAIDRLFADVVSDASTEEDEQLERAIFDSQIDNDFDGMS
jgi:hypothetical protein